MHMWKFHISMSVTKEVEFKERFVLLLITYYNKYIYHAVSSFLTIITYIFSYTFLYKIKPKSNVQLSQLVQFLIVLYGQTQYIYKNIFLMWEFNFDIVNDKVVEKWNGYVNSLGERAKSQRRYIY